ncbi:MAG: GAF domain-containing protein [Candidatus Hydrothermae bacterium]|nr:GAF domain-containing protein [Candidatus Hydrothermae bacterium]
MKLFRRFALGLSLLLLAVGVGLLLVSNISLKRHMLLFNYLFLKRESETAYNSVKRVYLDNRGINLERLQKLALKELSGNTSRFFVVDEKGKIVHAPNEMTRLIGLHLTVDLRGRKFREIEPFTMKSPIDGRSLKVSLRYFPPLKWYVGSITDEEKVLGPIHFERKLAIHTIALALLFLLISLLYLARNIFVKPLSRLASSIKFLQEGKPPAPGITGRKDVFGELVRCFSRLTQNLDLREKRLQGIGRLVLELIYEDDEDKFLKKTAEETQRLFEADLTLIAVKTPGEREILIKAASGLNEEAFAGKKFKIEEIPVLDSVLTGGITLREPVRDDRFGLELKGGTIIASPLKSGERILGCIAVIRGERDSFTRDDLHYLRVFANNVALAYIKSLSHGELKSLIKISKRLRAELDLSKILVEVDLAARSLLGADIIEIWMYENGRPNRIFTTDVDKLLDASEFRNFVEEAGRKLMVEGEPLYFEEIPFPKSAKDKGFPRSALFVPLYEREGITGHLNIYHLRKRRYSREEIELAQALGDQISIALMNSRILKNLEEHRKQLSVLLDISRSFTKGEELQDILEKSLTLSKDLLEMDAGILAVVTQEGAIKACSGIPVGYLAELLPGQILEGEISDKLVEKLKGKGLHLINLSPLAAQENGDKVGFMAFFSRKPRQLEPTQIRFLKSLSNQLSIGISALERAKELKKLSKQVVLSLSKAVELSDPYTRGHSERVAEYAVSIGKALGLEDEELETLEYAALLHDIGKVGVPYVILLKPGSLSISEWEIVKLHPVLSYMVLKNIFSFKKAADWVRYHHERFDGTGYPSGLKGEAIPLGSRIIAVADAFDALTTDRPYRSKLSTRDAKRVLREGAGIQWDPEIVKVALKVLKPKKEFYENPMLAELDQIRYRSTITFYRLPVLYSIISKFWEGMSLEEILDTTLWELLRSLRLEKGLIQLVEKGELKVKASFGFTSQNLEKLNSLSIADMEGILGIGINNMGIPAEYREFSRFADATDLKNLRVIVSVPIRSSKGEPIYGYISIMSARDRKFTEEERKFLEAVADHLALIIENKSYQELKRYTSYDIVKTLIRAMEIKGINVKGHSERVAFIAREIGRELGFNEEKLNKLYQAGLLHDIGKIVIPDTILAKAEVGLKYLDPEERKIVELHPVFGASLIEEIMALSELAPWIKYHSERYDGSGFPEGLKGEKIPLEARILSLAETFDAIVSRKGEGKISSMKAALKRLEELKEKWDPRVLEAAKKVIPRVFKNVPKSAPSELSLMDSFRREAFFAMRRLIVLYRISEEIKNLKNLDQFLDKVLEVIQEVSKHQILTIFVRDHDGNLRVAADRGLPVSLRGLVISRGKGIVGLVAETKKSVLVNDTGAEDRYISPAGLKTGSELAVPLLLGDDLIGVLDVENREKNSFTGEDLRFYEALSAYLATAVELAMKYREMESAVLSDRLTGAHTFRSLELRLEKLKKDVFTIAFIDLDGLKAINDRYGHPAGDEVLKTLVKVLRENLRKDDMVVRYGGDEFILVLPGTTKEEAKNHLDNLLRYITKLSVLLDDVILPFPGFSYGLATYPLDGADLQTLIRVADKGLYRVKMSKKS